jgi:hypothetical protein
MLRPLINRRCGTRSQFHIDCGFCISVHSLGAEREVSAMRLNVSSRSGEQSFETYHLLPHPTRRTAVVLAIPISDSASNMAHALNALTRHGDSLRAAEYFAAVHGAPH